MTEFDRLRAEFAELLEVADNAAAALEACVAEFGHHMHPTGRSQRRRVAETARCLIDKYWRSHVAAEEESAPIEQKDKPATPWIPNSDDHTVLLLSEVALERSKHPDKGFDAAYDATNSRNDWVGAAVAYIGRAADRVPRNEREGHNPREMLIKAAAILVAAIEDMDNKRAAVKSYASVGPSWPETAKEESVVLNKPTTLAESELIKQAMRDQTAWAALPMPVLAYVEDDHGAVATFYAIRDKRTLLLEGSPPLLFKSVQDVSSYTQGPLGLTNEIVKLQLIFTGLAE